MYLIPPLKSQEKTNKKLEIKQEKKMATPGKVKTKSTSPPCVSTNCSSLKLKSLYRTFHSKFSCSNLSSHKYLPINPTSRKTSSSVHLLEHELAKLDELFDIKDKNGNEENDSAATFVEDDNGSNICVWKGMPSRLVDGGYLFDLSENLSMQVSAPALIPVEIGSSFSQVVNRMASMGKENLIKWLLKSMPMCDLNLSKTTSEKPDSSEEGFLEAILIEGIEKVTTLALEGLKVQISGKLSEKAVRKSTKVGFEVENGLMEIMLIQMRDRSKGYECVGEIMIGLMEANLGERYENDFLFRGIHVAGILGGGKECGYMWSFSLRNFSDGSYRSSSDMVLRNPDIVLTS